MIEIERNEFVVGLIHEMYQIHHEHTSDEIDWEHPNGRKHLSKKEKYIVDTFNKVVEVLTKLDHLDYALIFLNSYTRSKVWREKYTKAEYFKYHFESYYNSIIGLTDRCAELVNFLFDLGLKGQGINIHNTVKKVETQNIEVLKYLQYLEKVKDSLNETRNHIQHVGTYSDAKLTEINTLEFIHKKGELEEEKRKIFRLQIEIKTSDYIRKQKRVISENNVKLRVACDKLFSSLLKMYNSSNNYTSITNEAIT
jgi:hypothetical protein